MEINVQTKFKHITNVLDGVATILLYDQIGSSCDENGAIKYGISGTDVAREIQYLNEHENVSKINIRINSIGGSVFDGYSIVSAMLNSKADCETYIDGLAASMAGIIAVAGKKCYMMDFGTLMLHNPSGDANSDVLSYIKSTLVTILVNRTKRSGEEIAFMMDAETWLNAVDAKKMGFVDEIISSLKPMAPIESPEKIGMFNLLNIYNKAIKDQTITNQNTNMENTEKIVELETKINELNTTIESTKSENEQLKAELEQFKKEKTEAAEKSAVALVDNAIELGKLKIENKESFVKLAIADYASVKNAIDAIDVRKVVKAVNVIETITKNKGENNERDKWTIRDWEKKDPKGLAEIRKNDADKYTEMYNAYYKKSK